MIQVRNNKQINLDNLFKDIRFYMGKSAIQGKMGEIWVDDLRKIHNFLIY